MSHLAAALRAQSHRSEAMLRERDLEDAAMRYYDEADAAHDAGNFARARYLRFWGDRTTMEARV